MLFFFFLNPRTATLPAALDERTCLGEGDNENYITHAAAVSQAGWGGWRPAKLEPRNAPHFTTQDGLKKKNKSVEPPVRD